MAITTTRMALTGRLDRRPWCAFGLLALVVCSIPCPPAVEAQVSVGPEAQASAPDGLLNAIPLLIGPGDLISVRVFNTPELTGELRVDDEGSVLLPLGGTIKVGGLTANQASRAIEGQLKASDVMLTPHVSVLVTQFATEGVTVLGEVSRPGTYVLLGPHSLYDALSAANGTTPNQGSRITITHQSDPTHPVVVNVTSADYSTVQRLTAIQPGDTVVVSRAEVIYVVGDVARPGPYPILSGTPLSTLNLLGLAQGLNRTALSKHASIIRQVNGTVVSIPLNLDKIMRSEEPNVTLQAADILVVPRSGRKTFLEFALPTATGAVISAVTSALIVR